MKGASKNLDRYLVIFTALKKLNLNFSDIAKALDISNAAVSQFAYGIDKSKRFDSWIMENLGIEL